MKSTHTLFIDQGSCGGIWSQEMPVLTAGVHPYLTHYAIASIFNPTGSGKIIQVNSINCKANSIVDNSPLATAPILLNVLVGTTAPDGIDISSSIVTLDTNETLSDVSAYINGSAESISGFSTVNKIPMSLNSTSGGAYPYKICTPRGGRNMNGTLFQGSAYGNDSSIGATGIIIRQDETLSLAAETLSNSDLLCVTIHFSYGNAQAILSIVVSPLDTFPLVSLRNSSATLVLDIQRIMVEEYAYNGTLSNAAFNVHSGLSLEYIDAINTDTGNSVTPIDHDTQYTWPSDIICKTNAEVKTNGSSKGAYTVIPMMRRLHPSVWGGTTTATIAGIQSLSQNLMAQKLFEEKINSDSAFIIPEGMGIAIFNRLMTSRTQFLYTINMTISTKERVYFGF